MRRTVLVAVLLIERSSGLTIVEQSLHKNHRPPPGLRHVEVPERIFAVKQALESAPFASVLSWTSSAAACKQCTTDDAIAALQLAHSHEMLEAVFLMSQTGGGFDSDTYCAPGSWEAMLEATRAWLNVLSLASSGAGPSFALTRPAGHHATRDRSMGFGLVNFAAASSLAHLDAHPDATLSILDWDVHYGNGVASILGDESRVRYCSLHEYGGFPGSGMDTADCGVLGNLLHLPLPKEAGSDEFLSALRDKALPFLLEPQPSILLICAGYDAVAADTLATMRLSPRDFGAAVRAILAVGFPRERIALGLEGGYNLDEEKGMPAAVRETCAALLSS